MYLLFYKKYLEFIYEYVDNYFYIYFPVAILNKHNLDAER